MIFLLITSSKVHYIEAVGFGVLWSLGKTTERRRILQQMINTGEIETNSTQTLNR